MIVCMHCYGSGDDPEVRTPREYAGITEYLDAVAEYIIRQKPERLTLLICGGMKDAKGIIEADSIAEAMRRRLEGRLHKNCIFFIKKVYEKSTISIVRFAFEWLRSNCIRPQIVIICDKAREGKTRWLAQRFSGGIPFEIIAFKRRDNWKTTILRSNRIAQMIELWLIKRNLERTRQKIEENR